MATEQIESRTSATADASVTRGHRSDGMNGLAPRTWISRLPSWLLRLPKASDFVVEEAWVIHRETGLLLSHASRGETIKTDPSMMSGMMQAIESLVSEEFDNRQTGIQRMQCGDRTLVLDRGRMATVAVAVRGRLLDEEQLGTTEFLCFLHKRYARQLQTFNGDRSEFSTLTDQLIAHINISSTLSERSRRRRIVMAAAMCGLIGVVGFAIPFPSKSRIRDFVSRLEAEPGYTIDRLEIDSTKHAFIAGRRDPLSRPFEEIQNEYGLNDVKFTTRFEFENSYDNEMVRKRIEHLLNPPKTVVVEFDGNVVKIAGSVERSWLLFAKMRAQSHNDPHLYFDFSRVHIVLPKFTPRNRFNRHGHDQGGFGETAERNSNRGPCDRLAKMHEWSI